MVGRLDRPKARGRAVEQLARQLNLAVPPGYTERLNVRIRRRGTVRRIPAGRQNATTPQELAFDDALRVQAVLALLHVPVVVCISAALLIASPLGDTAAWSGSSAVLLAALIAALPMFVLPAVTRSRWASRSYLRRFAVFSQPGPVAAC